MATLNERVAQLEQYTKFLLSKIADLSKNTEEKYKQPYTVSGGIKERGSSTPIDAKSGLNPKLSGHVIWNDTEVQAPLNKEPSIPSKGYNKHSHDRYSGGALIKDMLEIVEYDWDSTSPKIVNKHSQQFWKKQPKIKTEVNSKKQTVDKIGNLDLVFNPDTKTWGVAAYEIDIKKCNFVERDANGDIVTDSKGHEKKSPLYNEDQTKTSIVWDENAQTWRLYSAYAPGEE